MGDVVKGFLLLVLLIVGSAVAYLSWLILIPVTETDAEFRVANVCYGGQFLSSTLNGASHRSVACDCVNDGLVKTVGAAGMAKGADALRQIFVAQLWRFANGDTSTDLDKTLMADRDVLVFVSALDRLDKDCKISPFASAKR